MTEGNSFLKTHQMGKTSVRHIKQQCVRWIPDALKAQDKMEKCSWHHSNQPNQSNSFCMLCLCIL